MASTAHQYQLDTARMLLIRSGMREPKYLTFIEQHPQHAIFLAEMLTQLMWSHRLLTPQQFEVAQALLSWLLTHNMANQSIKACFRSVFDFIRFSEGFDTGSVPYQCLLLLNGTDLLNTKNLNILSNHRNDITSLYAVLNKLKKYNLLTNVNFKMLSDKAQHAEEIGNSLDTIAKEHLFAEEVLFTDDIFKILVDNARDANDIAYTLCILAGDGLVIHSNFKILSNNTRYALYIRDSISFLANADLLTDENIKMLMDSAQYARQIANCLRHLNEANLLTVDNLKRLAEHTQYAVNIDRGFRLLERQSLLNQNNVEILTNHAQYACIIAEGLKNLALVDILNDDNIRILIDHAEYANEVAYGLGTLAEAGLLNDDNIRILTNHAEYSDRVANGLGFLNQASLFTENYIKILTDHAKHAAELAFAFRNLNGLGLLCADNISVLTKSKAKNGKHIAHSLKQLFKANLLTRDNVIALIDSAQFARGIRNCLQRLRGGHLLTHDTFTTLINNAQYADYIAPAIFFIEHGGLLTNANWCALVKLAQQAPLPFPYRMFDILKDKHLLTQSTLDILFTLGHKAPHVQAGLEALKEELTQHTLDTYFNFVCDDDHQPESYLPKALELGGRFDNNNAYHRDYNELRLCPLLFAFAAEEQDEADAPMQDVLLNPQLLPLILQHLGPDSCQGDISRRIGMNSFAFFTAKKQQLLEQHEVKHQQHTAPCA